MAENLFKLVKNVDEVMVISMLWRDCYFYMSRQPKMWKLFDFPCSSLD